MLEKLMDWVRQIFGIKRNGAQRGVDKHAEAYEDIRNENVTATIANKLANYVFSDSLVNVDGTGKRAELVKDVIKRLMADAFWITAQAFGKGGKVIVPVVKAGKIKIKMFRKSYICIIR